MRRIIAPLLIGVIGAAILLWLCAWQVQRMAWKASTLAEIDAMLVEAPVALPALVSAERDRYRGVVVQGRFTGEAVFKLDSLQGEGPGKRVIAVFEMTGGRRIMIDRGIWLEGAEAAPDVAPDEGQVAEVAGNLDWPRETDSFTPPPDAATGLWFARDVPAMAAALNTEPVMVVTWAADPADPALVAIPVDTTHIPNDHLTYAITWFSLAVVWLGMTFYLLWRIRQRTA